MENEESKDSESDEDLILIIEEPTIETVLSEWKTSSKFKVKKFNFWLFPSALSSVFSLVSATILGLKYLHKEPLIILKSDNFTISTDNLQGCRNLTDEVHNGKDWTDTRVYADNLFTCETQNLVFGIATLSIQFLPGIQWYTSLKVSEHHRHRLWRFLSSLLFPFFAIWFKIAHCFHQGPETAKMNLKVTSCQTVLKNMVQVLQQVVILLWSSGIADVSNWQYVVLTYNLLKAAYEKAKENVREKKERKKKERENARGKKEQENGDHQVISPPFHETGELRSYSVRFLVCLKPLGAFV